MKHNAAAEPQTPSGEPPRVPWRLLAGATSLVAVIATAVAVSRVTGTQTPQSPPANLESLPSEGIALVARPVEDVPIPGPTPYYAPMIPPLGDVDLFIVGSEPGRHVQVTRDVLHEECPAWAPDRTSLVFLRRLPGGPTATGQVVLMKTSERTAPRDLTPATFDAGCPTWSPDGRHLALAGDPDGYGRAADRGLFLLEVRTGRITEIVEAPTIRVTHPPTWSNDGLQVAFIGESEGRDAVFVAEADDPDSAEIFGQARFEGVLTVRNPAWSPGERVLLMATTSNGADGYIEALEPDSSNPAEVVSTDAPIGAGPAWSPDGSTFAFTAGDELFLADTAGRILRNSDIGGPRGDTGYRWSPHVSWSPDGEHIAYLALPAAGQYPHLYTGDLVDGPGTDLTLDRLVPIDLDW